MKAARPLLLLLALGACANHPTDLDSTQRRGRANELSDAMGGFTVMTRNVYVGANVDNILLAPSPDRIPFLVAREFQTLLATRFPERAAAFADEIAAARPDLIGLQEISIIRRQSPGDFVLGGTTAAETLVFDYLEILLAALEARGLSYRVAATVQNLDIEVPMFTGEGPVPFDDIRLTDFDVILAHEDVAISRVEERTYAARLTVPAGDFVFDVGRGYTAVDATVDERTVRFVNTHLEPAVLAVRQAQARELLAALDHETNPVILVGDLNTAAPSGDTYRTLLAAGFADAWTARRNRRAGPGFTSNHDPDLRNTVIDLDQRIDYVLLRHPGAPGHFPGLVFATVVGDELGDRTPSGLWPSDHAGVVARMRIHGTEDDDVIDEDDLDEPDDP